jgi:DNA-directed RNA polymerase specialized sigma24 family protein
MKDGTAYRRWKDVEFQIARISLPPKRDWMKELATLHSETIVSIVRELNGADDETASQLFQELSRRIYAIARRWLRNLDKFTAQGIILQVEIEIMELILAPKPTRQSDFLEIAFAKAVEHRIIDALRKHKKSVFGHRGELQHEAMDEDYDENEEDERPIERVVDSRPDTEAVILALEDEVRRSTLVETAKAAVKERRWLEAVILHYVDGWPVTSTDPNTPSLVRRYKTTRWKVRHGMDQVLEAMRTVLGVEEKR